MPNTRRYPPVIISKQPTSRYDEGWDRIFGKKAANEPTVPCGSHDPAVRAACPGVRGRSDCSCFYDGEWKEQAAQAVAA